MTEPERRTDLSRPDTAAKARPVAVVTGVGRTVGIGAAIASRLASSGWDIAFTFWTPYDERMSWGPEAGATATITTRLTAQGAAVAAIEADLVDIAAPRAIFDQAERRLGPVAALVMCPRGSRRRPRSPNPPRRSDPAAWPG